MIKYSITDKGCIWLFFQDRELFNDAEIYLIGLYEQDEIEVILFDKCQIDLDILLVNYLPEIYQIYQINQNDFEQIILLITRDEQRQIDEPFP